jgi:hypothetical protein
MGVAYGLAQPYAEGYNVPKGYEILVNDKQAEMLCAGYTLAIAMLLGKVAEGTLLILDLHQMIKESPDEAAKLANMVMAMVRELRAEAFKPTTDQAAVETFLRDLGLN